MNISKAWDIHRQLTEKASNLVRQLAFAGIAIIWTFRVDAECVTSVSSILVWAGLLIVLCLLSDLLHYVVSAIPWYFYARIKERPVGPDDDFRVPPSIRIPSYIFYYSKIALLIIGYILLGVFMIDSLRSSL